MIIQEVMPQDNFVLRIIGESGESGTFDVTPYLDSEAFEPLKILEEFKKIRNGKYFVEWECGADLSSDTIKAHMI